MPANASRAIIGAGIIPGGMEMMDRPAIHAAEEFVHAGYPLDVEALLIVELDGPAAEVDHLIGRVDEIAKACRLDHVAGCRTRKTSGCCSGPAARRRFRRSAASRRTTTAWTAPSRAPSCRRCSQRMRELSEQYGLRVANVFHAGDGNLHPLILYDANKPGELEKTEAFGADILKLCVEVGGVLTGEHGVGVEKRDLMPAMFTEIDLDQQQRRQMRLRRRGPAQSRQGVSDSCTAAPNSAGCTCMPASCRSRTFRGSDRNFQQSAPCQSYSGLPAQKNCNVPRNLSFVASTISLNVTAWGRWRPCARRNFSCFR